MSEKMSEKQEIIKKMLAMQKKFIDQERKHGVSAEELWAGQEGQVLADYKDKYAELANKVVDLAHAEKGSHR